MAEADDDGWAKAREMVLSAPPPPLSAEATRERLEQAVAEPPQRQLPVKAIVLVLIVGAAIAGVAYITFAPQVLEKINESAPQASSSVESVSATQGKATAAKETASKASPAIAIRKGLASVNVRGDPSVSKPPIAKLNGGAKVERVEASGDWLKIRFSAEGKQREGWIRRDMLE